MKRRNYFSVWYTERIGVDSTATPPEGSPQFAASIAAACSSLEDLREASIVPQQLYPLEALWRRNLLQYNPLLDFNNKSYLTAPRVVRHLIKQGFMAQVNHITLSIHYQP